MRGRIADALEVLGIFAASVGSAPGQALMWAAEKMREGPGKARDPRPSEASEEIVVKMVMSSSYGPYMESRGRVDIQAEDGRWFDGISEMWRYPYPGAPKPGETVKVGDGWWRYPWEPDPPTLEEFLKGGEL